VKTTFAGRDLAPERISEEAAAPACRRKRALRPQYGKEPQRRLRITLSPEEPLDFPLMLACSSPSRHRGSGKTTQVEMLGEWLSSHDPVVIREPGGTELGERFERSSFTPAGPRC